MHDVRLLHHVRGSIVIGLADRGSVFGTAYPAVSRDGGRTWAIDGPEFWYAAAQGPDVTDHISVTGDRTIVAWGRGGNLVKVSSNLGHRWMQSAFPSGVDDVRIPGRRIVVRALGRQLPRGSDSGRFATWCYVSIDDGLHWRRTERGRPTK